MDMEEQEENIEFDLMADLMAEESERSLPPVLESSKKSFGSVKSRTKPSKLETIHVHVAYKCACHHSTTFVSPYSVESTYSFETAQVTK